MPTDTPTAIPVGHHGVRVILVPRAVPHEDWVSVVAADGQTLVAQLHVERDAAAIAALGGEPAPRFEVEVLASLPEIAAWYEYLWRLRDLAPPGMVDRICAALDRRWAIEHGAPLDTPEVAVAGPTVDDSPDHAACPQCHGDDPIDCTWQGHGDGSDLARKTGQQS